MNGKNEESNAEKIKYHLGELWNFASSAPQEFLTVLKDQSNPVLNLFNLDFLINDNDLDEKRAVYQHISEFIKKFVDQPHRVLLYITYQLCEETDEVLLSETNLSKEEIREAINSLLKIKELIIALKVHYERPSENPEEPVLRKTEIWHLKNERPAVFSVEEKMNWEDLSGDVREEYIRTKEKSMTFKLYPKE